MCYYDNIRRAYVILDSSGARRRKILVARFTLCGTRCDVVPAAEPSYGGGGGGGESICFCRVRVLESLTQAAARMRGDAYFTGQRELTTDNAAAAAREPPTARACAATADTVAARRLCRPPQPTDLSL